MLKNFKCFNRSVTLHQECRTVRIPSYLKDQLLRASSSISLNLAEGNDRATQKDKLCFFNRALTSLREVQAICAIENLTELEEGYSELGAMLYRLCTRWRC